MAKKQSNFRLSNDAVASLRRLADILNISMAAALEVAIQETLHNRSIMIGHISVSVGQSPSKPKKEQE